MVYTSPHLQPRSQPEPLLYQERSFHSPVSPEKGQNLHDTNMNITFCVRDSVH